MSQQPVDRIDDWNPKTLLAAGCGCFETDATAAVDDGVASTSLIGV